MGGGGSRNYIKGCVRVGRGSGEGVGNKVGVDTGLRLTRIAVFISRASHRALFR